MSKVFIITNEQGIPDVWSYVDIPGSTEFDESSLPENYSVQFGERLWKIVDGELVENIIEE
jgi:hypothetical protein